jgi:hypothetical protein
MVCFCQSIRYRPGSYLLSSGRYPWNNGCGFPTSGANCEYLSLWFARWRLATAASTSACSRPKTRRDGSYCAYFPHVQNRTRWQRSCSKQCLGICHICSGNLGVIRKSNEIAGDFKRGRRWKHQADSNCVFPFNRPDYMATGPSMPSRNNMSDPSDILAPKGSKGIPKEKHAACVETDGARLADACPWWLPWRCKENLFI